MDKSKILYVKGMNMSESDAEEVTDEDIWDDEKLTEAYDRALRIANADVAKRIAMSTNTKIFDKEGHSKRNNHSRSLPVNGYERDPKPKWRAGMPCRAVYEGDGIEYEATILKINNDKECIVRFLGYDDPETVAVTDLKPSLGSEERTCQIERACLENDEACTSPKPRKMSECGSEAIPIPDMAEGRKKRKKSNKKKNKNNKQTMNGFVLPEVPFTMPDLNAIRNLGGELPLPPPPPLSLMATDCDDEDQAIWPMLLSWYMSGYYTGLYQGMKGAKKSRRNIL